MLEIEWYEKMSKIQHGCKKTVEFHGDWQIQNTHDKYAMINIKKHILFCNPNYRNSHNSEVTETFSFHKIAYWSEQVNYWFCNRAADSQAKKNVENGKDYCPIPWNVCGRNLHIHLSPCFLQEIGNEKVIDFSWPLTMCLGVFILVMIRSSE